MAKIKVKKEFVDIHTNILHPVGEVFEADEKRIAEILGKDKRLIQVLKDEEPAKKSRKKVSE